MAFLLVLFDWCGVRLAARVAQSKPMRSIHVCDTRQHDTIAIAGCDHNLE